MWQCPPGFRLYADVMARLPDGRKEGGGITFRCPFKDRHKNGDRRPSAYVKVGERGELVARCNGCGAGWRDFVDWVGLPASAWWPAPLERRMDHPKAKPVEHYPYTDQHGELIAVKTRWEPGFNGRSKDFTWKRPLPEKARKFFEVPQGVDAWAAGEGSLKGGWFSFHKQRADGWYFGPTVDRLDGKATELPSVLAYLSLYRLPELIHASPDYPVVVVEGERKADRLAALGFVATSGYAGKGKWEYSWGSWFKGRRVCVIPDRDPGDVALEYAHKVVASACYYEAAEVRVVELPIPELKPDMAGGDVVDWLARKFPADSRATTPDRRAAVAALCKAAVPYRRAA